MTAISERLMLRSFELQDKSLSDIWNEKQGQKLPERLGKMAVCALLRSKCVHSQLTDRSYPDFPSYKLMNRGYEQIVLSSGKEVLKVVLRTDAVENGTPDETAHKMQTNSDTCRRVLGDSWLPTSFDVVKRPSNGEKVIVAHQPLIDPTINFETIEDLVVSPSISPTDRQEFGDAIRELHDTYGLYPDLIGRNNVVAIGNVAGDTGLCIVDTIAIDQTGQQRTLWPDPRTVGERMAGQLALLIAT